MTPGYIAEKEWKIGRPAKPAMTGSEREATAAMSTRDAAAWISEVRGSKLRAANRVSHVWVRLQRKKWKQTQGGMKVVFPADVPQDGEVETNASVRDIGDPEHHQKGAAP